MLLLRNLDNTFNCIFLKYFNLIEMQYDLELRYDMALVMAIKINLLLIRFMINIRESDLKYMFLRHSFRLF